MNLSLAIAATAAVLLAAAPAGAETAIHISTAGKSAEQVKLEVKKAAQQICFEEARGTVGYLAAYTSCVQASMREALVAPQTMKLASK
jgi:hypothetical protein